MNNVTPDKTLITADLFNKKVTLDDNNNLQFIDAEGNRTNLTTDEVSQVETEYATQLADYDAKQYQRDRQYPSIGDQLDMQYWDAVNGTTTWKDAIAQVKADNPKPQE